MPFENVKRVSYHGPEEKGIDIGPFYEIDRFGLISYFGAQVKNVKIHMNSKKFRILLS
jgi:hypothetical protein